MLQQLLRAILSSLETNPAASLATAQMLVGILRATPSLLAGLLPTTSTIPVVVYAKAHPSEAIDLVSAELDLLAQHQALFAAAVASAPAPHA